MSDYEIIEVENPVEPQNIQKVAQALIKVQGEIHNPTNTATNPFFKSKYAPLSNILNDVRPLLSKHGLVVFQEAASNGEHICIKSHLLHESGQSISTRWLRVKPDKTTPQGAGSAITYLRRYQLSALLGISSEDDDDGEAAEPQRPQKQMKVKNKKPVPWGTGDSKAATYQEPKQSKKTPKTSTTTKVLSDKQVETLNKNYPILRPIIRALNNTDTNITKETIIDKVNQHPKLNEDKRKELLSDLRERKL